VAVGTEFLDLETETNARAYGVRLGCKNGSDTGERPGDDEIGGW
jgi:hypothetical protein